MIADRERINAQLEWCDATIAALRGVLAPLLDDPFESRRVESYPWNDTERRCRFCGVEVVERKEPTNERDRRGRRVHAWIDRTPHAPGCPVRRKDELLGRVPA